MAKKLKTEDSIELDDEYQPIEPDRSFLSRLRKSTDKKDKEPAFTFPALRFPTSFFRKLMIHSSVTAIVYFTCLGLYGINNIYDDQGKYVRQDWIQPSLHPLDHPWLSVILLSLNIFIAALTWNEKLGPKR